MPVIEAQSRQGFWTDYQPGFRLSEEAIGTPEFFDDVERRRYALEPEIHEKADFAERRDQDVLEAGCGIATDGINFARWGARYTGVDFSDSAVALAEQRFEMEGQRGRILQGSITHIPVADESQDFVYSNGVIHHIPDTERVIDEMFRVLRPGGHAVVMVYHRDSINYFFSIGIVRRALAVLTLVPGAPKLIARITGEQAEVIAGHRELLREHGIRYLTDKQLFLNHNTDGPGNPLSKVYSRGDAGRLFQRFTDVQTDVRSLNLRLYPGGRRLESSAFGRWLERRFGWHLWIEATKPAR